MSRYQTLEVEAENAYISPFTVGHMLSKARTDPELQATLLDPNPNPIPSNFDHYSWKTLGRRTEPVRSQPPEKIIDRQTLYGPSSSGHASLRYYGTGPY